MTTPNISKADLMVEIERSWAALHSLLGRLTEEQMTEIRDAEGWSVKDHVIHLESWERSVVYFLQGKTRHEGLGVDESVYIKGGFDEINDVIYRERKELPLAEALARFDEVHQQLLALLEKMSDADLQQPYRRDLSDETGDGEGPMVYDLIHGNSAGHYEEHRGWIEEWVWGRGG
jgi:hypothetical protein